MAHAHQDATGAPPIRLGIVLDAWEQPRWIADAVREAIESGAVSPVWVALPSGPTTLRLTSPARGVLRRAYDAFDRARFPLAPDVTIPTDLRTQLGDVARSPATWPTADAIPSLDLVLNLSRLIGTPSLAPCARWGAASFEIGETEGGTLEGAGFDEVVRGAPLVGARLVRWANETSSSADGRADDRGDRRISTVTNAHAFSARRTMAIAAVHSVSLLTRLARALALDATGASSPATTSSRSPSGAPALERRQPSDVAEQLTGIGRVLTSYARFAANRGRTRDQWTLAWARRDGGHGREPELDLAQYRELFPPADRFWADPFPMRVDGREYLLFEELLFAEDVGYLVAVEMGSDGPLGDPVTILKRPYHLSYPFVFEYDGETYLLPESADEGRLELYRAVRPPFEWVLDRVLIQGPMLIDATIEEIDGRWWLFACEYRAGQWPWTDLVLYHAESPLGPWEPHPRNPVYADARVARPAGRLFRQGDAWIRPAQDCSRSYGGALSLRRIVTLTPTEYAEEEVAYLAAGPEPGKGGPHTINALDGLSVIDLKRVIAR